MRFYKLAVLLVPLACAFTFSPANADSSGAVYTMTNAPEDNQIVVFTRNPQGLLSLQGTVSTGGKGSGGGIDPLASQGSLVLMDDGAKDFGLSYYFRRKHDDDNWLMAVNAGSNDISVFHVTSDGIDLASQTPSGGTFPVSITNAGNLVYVLNNGDQPNITGFWMAPHGRLIPLPHSTRQLSDGNYAQIAFAPSGRALVITDKANHRLLVYRMTFLGIPENDPETTASSGQVPFAIDFDDKGHVLVAEAATNAVSSYRLRRNGSLQVITASELNNQIATCWIVVSEYGDVFTTNPGTNSLSSFHVDRRGRVSLLNGVAANGQAPLDIDLGGDDQFLYAVDPPAGAIDMFKVEEDGSLTSLGTIAAGIDIFAQGLAAF